MTSAPVDPLQQLSAALAVPADSPEQFELLSSLRTSLETHPAPIPILCTTLIKTLSGAGDSLLKRWVLDLLHYGICNSSLTVDARTNLASQSLDTLANLLYDHNPFTVKVVVQCFAAAYPLLFRMLCQNRQNRQPWDALSHAKTRIIDFIWGATVSTGVKLAAVKFAQRVIVVQTRGISDPRLQRKDDPNIAMCPSDHPFISIATLEQEGLKLLESVITLLYTTQNVDILTALINSWAQLPKIRPALTQLVVSTLTSWTPAALAGLPASSIKSVEKAVRILLIHLSRTSNAGPFVSQINEALAQQGARMDRAAAEEKARRAAAAAEAARKRQASSAPLDAPSDTKRVKLEAGSGSSSSFLANFDWSSLPATMVTDFIVANLQALSDESLASLVQAYRQAGGSSSSTPPIPLSSSSAIPLPGPASSTVLPSSSSRPPTAPLVEGQSTGPAQLETAMVKEEPVDPLAMNIDNEEMEYEPDKLNDELSGAEPPEAEEEEPDLDTIALELREFKLPPPRDLEDVERDALIRKSFGRLWDEGGDVSAPAADGANAPELWMLLLIRTITRVVEPPPDESSPVKKDEEQLEAYMRQDRQRQILCDYVMANFPKRVRLATTWMNEEWYNDRVRSAKDPGWRPNYDTWLRQIVDTYQTQLDGKDRTFSRFLLDIPSVPSDTLSLVRELCVEPDRREVGFTTLRGFVLQRPSLRIEAMTALLDLTTHSEKLTRAAAINTVRRWVVDAPPMDNIIRAFALNMLRRLQAGAKGSPNAPDTATATGTKNGAAMDEEPVTTSGDAEAKDKEDSEPAPEQPGNTVAPEANAEDNDPGDDIVQTPYLPERIELPAQKQEILQHVELLFALCVKRPDFLDEIFAAYCDMDITVQETIQELITPLVKSLGPSHGKLLTLLRTFPSGAESLALRVLTIFTDHGRPSGTLVALVKSLIAERNLDARFLIPIIAEMDKADIIRHLPRIVSMLNGTVENKTLVRNVFNSIVGTPAQTFGAAATSNLPRVRQSELLTPAELMVMLHDSEKEVGLKSAIEAIGVCFSMTDIYRSEVLAIVMQQIVDEPTLPTLFMRTVIQAVTTYKSLIPFVSTTLFSRLIIKKIWTNPPLWEGFIRCAKIIAPASFAILLQLPKEQLRDLVDKQPTLKAGLRDHVVKKAGNKARVPGFLDIFGDDETKPTTPDAKSTP